MPMKLKLNFERFSITLQHWLQTNCRESSQLPILEHVVPEHVVHKPHSCNNSLKIDSQFYQCYTEIFVIEIVNF